MTRHSTGQSRRLAIVALAVWLGAGCSYNKFTAQEEAIKAQWSQVENQLQRRNDLIPNLVETVKGFAKQEQTVFQAVADARAKMAGAQTPADKMAAANAETSALGRLFVVMEAYPQLKSNEEFARLMDELSSTENKLSTERMRYNDRVREYNTNRHQFPANMTGKMFGFKDAYPYFEVPADAKAVPKVNFGKGTGGL
jgi:LemA protein